MAQALGAGQLYVHRSMSFICADQSLTDIQRWVYLSFVEDGEPGIQYSTVKKITKPVMSAERLISAGP